MKVGNARGPEEIKGGGAKEVRERERKNKELEEDKERGRISNQ